MKRFKFPLAGLLAWRTHQQNLARIELGRRVSRGVALDRQINDCRLGFAASSHADISGSLDYRQNRHAKIIDLGKQRESAKQEESKARQAYIAALRPQKILENLRKRQQKAAALDQQRAAQIISDEQVIQARARRKFGR